MKIVVTNNQDFSEAQKQRLNSLGDVTYYDKLPQNAEEYLERVKGADIICSGRAGLQNAYAQLKDVYVTVAFVSVAFVDLEVLKKNNVTISNAPGANKYAVSEWVAGMIIMLSGSLNRFVNSTEEFRRGGNLPPTTPGLAGKKITILGHGNIGTRVGEITTTLGMDVTFFNKGDDLEKSVKDADIVVDALSSNPSTEGLLNGDFFQSMKKGSYFVTVTGPKIVDYDAMLKAIDGGILAGAASDCGSILVGDIHDPLYQKLLNHPKVLVTPHVSYNTDMTNKTGGDIMIDNVESWINGKPQNVVEE